MPLNQRINNENVVHLRSKVLLRGKNKNYIMKFACKWTEVEENILSEVNQIQKLNMECTHS